MKRRPKQRGLVSAWLEKADRDLRLTELAASHRDPAGDLICFHAQQCAEKYLKGCTGDEGSHMTGYAISSRYPDLWEEVSRSEALEAVQMARRIRQAVEAFLVDRGWTDA